MARFDLGAALRRFHHDPIRQARVACVLWLLLAAVVWNVVFDRVLVLAGRRYSYAALNAFTAGQPPVLIQPWMSAAQASAVRLASMVAAPIAIVGLVAVALASRRSRA